MSSGATPKPPAPEWMSLENLLRIATKNDHLEVPTEESKRAEYVNSAPLKHPVEISFSGASPIVVDRFVNFLYLHEYQRHIETEVSNITHAENKPNSPYIDFTRDMKSVRFDLEMVSFAEFLEYPALIDAAYVKLVEQFLFKGDSSPTAMKDFVEWIYGAGKICEDKVGSLKQLIVAATFVYGRKFWEKDQRDEFVGLVQHQESFVRDMAAATLALQQAGESS
ncbi:uncharacterized protein J4E84_003517 [Alternaria hordeiaustralica]|uniref:uncharacterized protein n=1 Tax=Alternaria hordeiaustralica TaxID=1187925 RepID=UPI0020C54EEF|nr:uncharacterized protein J4E84_003517 [Alternaria hordeiaustralica]KAI4691226.1 hypothetical protein J4E84_003517 [Alternaria hordeiaustralica]